jgi:hypothetical protein
MLAISGTCGHLGFVHAGDSHVHLACRISGVYPIGGLGKKPHFHASLLTLNFVACKPLFLQDGKWASKWNGIKLSSNTLLYQSLTRFSTWFREERIWFRAAFDGARLDTVRAVRIDDQRRQGFPRHTRQDKPGFS